jgi:hypothetical protein
MFDLSQGGLRCQEVKRQRGKEAEGTKKSGGVGEPQKCGVRNIQLTAEHAETAEGNNTISQRTLSTLRSRLLRRTGALSGEIILRVGEWVDR